MEREHVPDTNTHDATTCRHIGGIEKDDHAPHGLPRISLGTVYRNLDFLADSGEIRRLEAAGTTKRFDGNMVEHQHVRCLCCGRIGDIMTPLPTPPVSGMHVPGFSEIRSARIEFDGICDQCASARLVAND